MPKKVNSLEMITRKAKDPPKPVVISKKDAKILVEDYETVRDPEVVPRHDRRPSLKGVHDQMKRYTRSTNRQMNTMIPRNVEHEGIQGSSNMEAFRQYDFDHKTNRYAHERLPPFLLKESQSDEDLLSFFPKTSKKYTWEHFGHKGEVEVPEPEDWRELYPVDEEEDAKEAPLGKFKQEDPEDEEVAEIQEIIVPPDTPPKPEEAPPSKVVEPKPEERKVESPKPIAPVKEEPKKIEEPKVEIKEKENEKEAPKKTEEVPLPIAVALNQESPKKKIKKSIEIDEPSKHVSSKKKHRILAPVGKPCECSGDGDSKKKEKKCCTSSSEDSCCKKGSKKTGGRRPFPPSLSPWVQAYNAQFETEKCKPSKQHKHTCTGCKTVKCAEDEGIDFTFRPITGHATEFELIIEPDEDDPLDYALNNGIAPVICSTLPPSIMANNQACVYNSPYGYPISSGPYGNYAQMYQYQYQYPPQQPFQYPQQNYYYNNYSPYGNGFQ